MPHFDVVVCVPTFRRPIGLERCLTSLAKLTIDRSLRIIVADNDPEKREGVSVCSRLVATGFRFPITTVVVSERGIAPNRNALVAEALSDPTTRLIAMIDDDEWAEPAWLAELLMVESSFDADIVGGPVLRTFQSPVPSYVAKANQPEYDKTPTGLISLVDATSNILFRAQLFRERSSPWFDPQYALMGCEDKDILLGYKLAGKRFAWSDKALVSEEMPTSRCSAKWMLQRAYRVGNTDMLINLKHHPPGFNAFSEATKIGGAALLAVATMVLFAWHPARRFRGARLGARVIGKLTALAGQRHQEYRIIHGS